MSDYYKCHLDRGSLYSSKNSHKPYNRPKEDIKRYAIQNLPIQSGTTSSIFAFSTFVERIVR